MNDMPQQKLLIIGSVTTDIILHVPHLPNTTEDILIQHQQFSLGGCAGNIAMLLHALYIPFDLFVPVGQGMYGDFVFQELQKQGLQSLIPRGNEENGCCYCMVDQQGERTFLSYHGAEYRFHKEWFSLLDPAKYDQVYVCGLELEEASGQHILTHLKQAQYQTIYFAPGPRICHIAPSRMQAMLDLHCVLHLNEQEALAYTSCSSIIQAINDLYEKTQNTVIITSGEKGCLINTGEIILHLHAQQQSVVDTIGAGDTHIAAFMAACMHHATLKKAGLFANLAGSIIVGRSGAHLLPQDIAILQQQLQKISDLDDLT